MKISEIDKNFSQKTSLNEKNIIFCDPTKPPFSLYGVIPPDEKEKCYRRMPGEIAEKVNKGVEKLYTNTAGGRVRFKTDSLYVAIKARYPDFCNMPHMTFCGSAGFSIYTAENGKQIFYGSYFPTGKKKYENIQYFQSRKMREITIYFPLYNNVSELYIGLEKDCEILPADKYKTEVPVVYYGSSITQGGCASRPGNDYEGILSRALDCDFLNLGFSGNAKGELTMAEYIGGLDMSVFVMDYDHNAPNPEHLAKTHEPFFKAFRKLQPDTPVIFVSRPDQVDSADRAERFNIIKKTYDNAVNSGDKNVYLIDGGKFFDELEFNDYSVDNCHPNDLGFYFMAKGIEPILRKCMEK